MKNIALVILLVISTVTTAQERKVSDAQKNEVEENLAQYFAKLNLTEEQKVSYEEVIKKYGEQHRFIKESGLSEMEKLKEIQKIRSQKDAEMKKLLTKEQYEAYKAFKAKVQKIAMENYSGEFTEYLNRLDLSEEQQSKFIEISKRYRGQFMALKNSPKSRLSKYREYKDMQNNKDSEMQSLLSPDQYEVYLEVQHEVQKKIRENNGK
ncbi:MAG: hypothetical protein WBG90_15680 [Saonia sp.]